MSGKRTFIVVGASHAGGRAAQAIRQTGFEDRVVLVGEEPYLPYERPPLSKELLVGDDGIEKARILPPSWYEEHHIELRLGTRVEAIDRKAREIVCAGEERIPYDKLMLTVGGRVRRLPIAGADLPGVHYLRDYRDTEAIRDGLRQARRVVVIGGGFIGLEVAASARKRGCPVTVVEATDRLMGRAVAPEIGAWFADLHRSNGTDLRLGAGIEAIEGNGKVERVALSDGSRIDAEMVVIGIGIVPNAELAAEAGLEVDNGIVVDAFGRTSDPDIYAAGDCVSQPNDFLGRWVRLESYQNAQDQAMAVGRNMCADAGSGEAKPYNDRLWVWTDQYDVNLQMLGQPDEYDRLIWRGDPEAGGFTVFYMRGNRIVGVNTVNNGKEMRLAERLMYAGLPVADDALADPETKLRALMKQ